MASPSLAIAAMCRAHSRLLQGMSIGMQQRYLMPCCARRVQATQRTGRAGRTRAGKCFRLYTRAAFENEMLAETVPEILRTSLQAAVLHLKTLPLNVDILHFDYMDAPKVQHRQSLPCASCPLQCSDVAG